MSRAPSATDRRSHDLALSDEGRTLDAQVAPKALELEKQIFGGIGADELRAFVATLRRIDGIVAALMASPTRGECRPDPTTVSLRD